jgi:hypothetical protein
MRFPCFKAYFLLITSHWCTFYKIQGVPELADQIETVYSLMVMKVKTFRKIFRVQQLFSYELIKLTNRARSNFPFMRKLSTFPQLPSNV